MLIYRRAIEAIAVGKQFHIFAIGQDNGMYHKYWDGKAWNPSGKGWESLGGVFVSPPAAAMRSYIGESAFDVVGIGTKNDMNHKYWDGKAWNPSGKNWETLGGSFTSVPAISSFDGPNAVDIFAVGTDNQMYHRYLDGKGAWQPSDWEALGGTFISPPAVSCLEIDTAALSYGATVNVFAIGQDNQMYHKLLDSHGAWHPAKTAAWDALGGAYVSPPAAVGVNNVELDFFALGLKNGMQHNLYGGSGIVGSWQGLGGTFVSLPAPVVGGYCDAPTPLLCNIYVFALGTDNNVYYSSAPIEGSTVWSSWKGLGGVCASAPAGGLTWSLADGSDSTVHVAVISAASPVGEILHKSFSQSGGAIVWQPSEAGWDSLGGTFIVP